MLIRSSRPSEPSAAHRVRTYARSERRQPWRRRDRKGFWAWAGPAWKAPPPAAPSMCPPRRLSRRVVRRIAFTAGGGLGWSLSALITPRAEPCPLKIVVVPGAPSWSEYWAPVLAALPADREMVVVDRPGFAASEPAACVPDIRMQAAALAPLLEAAPGQKILLVGQSYGAAIATVMAAEHPKSLAGVVLLSSYLGQPGPTARWLVDLGSRVLTLIPARPAQRHPGGQQPGRPARPHARGAAPPERAGARHPRRRRRLRAHRTGREAGEELRTRAPIRFVRVPGANHFLNDGPVDVLMGAWNAASRSRRRRSSCRPCPCRRCLTSAAGRPARPPRPGKRSAPSGRVFEDILNRFASAPRPRSCHRSLAELDSEPPGRVKDRPPAGRPLRGGASRRP